MQASVSALLEELSCKAETIEDHGRLALLEKFGPKIRTDKPYGWIAVVGDWDLGHPMGVSMTERGAILDLLAWLEMDEEATP